MLLSVIYDILATMFLRTTYRFTVGKNKTEEAKFLFKEKHSQELSCCCITNGMN